MRSIKPGRGPSLMGGVGSIVIAFFGIVWTFAAASMGAPWFFPLFGVIFVIMGIVQGVYHLNNASRKNRYSTFDITDEHEEPDPMNERFSQPRSPQQTDGTSAFCPYCGAAVESDHRFCRKCGREV